MRARVALGALLLLIGGEASLAQTSTPPSFPVWLCPEHRQHPQDGPGSCPLCARPLVQRQLAVLWSCPMHQQVTRPVEGTCPFCGMALLSTTQELEWFCGRHPEIVRAEPGACPRDGEILSLRGRIMPHGDHNPRHGGILFMAGDGFHHLEGTLGPDGLFRLYLYDDFTRPLDARAFRARAGALELRPSADGAFLSHPTPAPGLGGTVELTVHVTFPSSAREEQFDFVLSPESVSPAVGQAEVGQASPEDAEGLLEAIRARSRRLDELVARGAWPDLFIPALEAKDLALALLEREGDRRLALPVKNLVRAAWLLDLHGDLGKKVEVEAAHRLFQRALLELEEAHGR